MKYMETGMIGDTGVRIIYDHLKNDYYFRGTQVSDWYLTSGTGLSKPSNAAWTPIERTSSIVVRGDRFASTSQFCIFLKTSGSMLIKGKTIDSY
jgi:hypothetical protein